MIGRTIDRYCVVEQLGQGGMGVVYKARDTLLDRFVALKVLPPDRSSDPDRRRRFLQEAKSASALNHPGIVSVFDVLSVDDQDILVMELVEGETLEDLLVRRRPSLSQALDLAARIADALGRAHAAGIVHRDLKPSNVMVTSDGVKVLDFGLAKLVDVPSQNSEAATLGPDDLSLTRERVILGTTAWMSPEQASGRPVDSRSDIFAFGIVLYQLLTGRHPFRRDTTLETLAAIREQEPEPPSRLVPALPPDIDRSVMRCLAKDPVKRWQSLSDLGTVLWDLKEDTESGRRVIIEAAPARTRRVRWPLVAAALVVAAAIAASVILLNRRPPETGPLELRRLTYDGGFSVMPAISPDGKLIAYASDRGGDGQLDIWIRHVNRAEPARLTDDPADEMAPRFSPDGSRIVYHSERDGGSIWIINALGGEPRKLANGGIFPKFSPDGSVVSYAVLTAYSTSSLLEMFTVPVDGGEPTPLVPGFGTNSPPSGVGPLWSPDGTRVLFKGAPLDDPAQRDWWVAPVDGGPPVSSGGMQALAKIDIVQFPCDWLPGRILVLAGTTFEGMNLYGASISPNGQIEGPLMAYTSGPGMMWTPSVSTGGRIAVSKFQWVIHLWQIEIDLTTGKTVGSPARLTNDDAPKFGFSVSHNGSLLAFSDYSGPRENRVTEVRLRNLETGHERVLDAQAGPIAFINEYPRLNADGTRIAWTARVDRKRKTLVAPVAEPVGVPLADGIPLSFFSDGSSVLLWQAPNNLVKLAVGDTAGTVILSPHDLEIIDADLSWDDRWLAVSTATPEGRVGISLVPVNDPPVPESEWIDLDDGSPWLGTPRWSPDGSLLYYLSDRDDFTCVWARPLDPVSRQPTGDPFAVLHAHRDTMKMWGPRKGAFSMALGGRRLVFNAAEMTGEIYTATLPEAR